MTTKTAEVLDKVKKGIEDLEVIKDRSSIFQDEMMAQMSQRQNRSMFLLAVFSLIFLPLTFMTGLLGVNVGGLPLADHPSGFAILAIILAGVVVIEVFILWWAGWFKR